MYIVEEVLKEVATRNKDNEVVKTSETPQEMTPLERAMALRRKSTNKYENAIIAKYLPCLDK